MTQNRSMVVMSWLCGDRRESVHCVHAWQGMLVADALLDGGGGGGGRGGTHLDGDWGAVPSATVHDTELAFTEDSAQGEFVRGDLPVGVVDVLECRGHVGGEGAERSRLGRQQQRLVLKDPGTSLHAWCALQTITYGGEEG